MPSLQLLCDEYVEKTERVRALKQKIEQVKKLHGEYSVSGEGGREGGGREGGREGGGMGGGREGGGGGGWGRKGGTMSPVSIYPGLDVQNFYDSLDVKDSEIYCQRGQEAVRVDRATPEHLSIPVLHVWNQDPGHV